MQDREWNFEKGERAEEQFSIDAQKAGYNVQRIDQTHETRINGVKRFDYRIQNLVISTKYGDYGIGIEVKLRAEEGGEYKLPLEDFNDWHITAISDDAHIVLYAIYEYHVGPDEYELQGMLPWVVVEKECAVKDSQNSIEKRHVRILRKSDLIDGFLLLENINYLKSLIG